MTSLRLMLSLYIHRLNIELIEFNWNFDSQNLNYEMSLICVPHQQVVSWVTGSVAAPAPPLTWTDLVAGGTGPGLG